MTIPDPLLDQEPFVEQETLVVTREWYSWLGLLIREIRAELADVRTDLDTLEAEIVTVQTTLADHEARITDLETP